MTPHAILLRCAVTYGLSVATLQSSKRTRYISHARQCAAWCIKTAFPDITLQEIGDLLHKDHTTVLYGLKAVERRMASDSALATQLRAIIALERRIARKADDRAFWGVTVAVTA